MYRHWSTALNTKVRIQNPHPNNFQCFLLLTVAHSLSNLNNGPYSIWTKTKKGEKRVDAEGAKQKLEFLYISSGFFSPGELPFKSSMIMNIIIMIIACLPC